LFELAEIDPCKKHACPKPAGGARRALAITAALHAMLIAALAAISIAQPSPPKAEWIELQATFATAPRTTPDPQAPQTLAGQRPRLLADAGGLRSAVHPPTPTRLAFPEPALPLEAPWEAPRQFEREFIPAEEALGDEITPPSRPEKPAPSSEGSDRIPPKKAQSATNPKFLPARVHKTSRPKYPTSAMHRGDEGVAQIHLSLDVTGRVIRATLSSSSGHPALDAAALKAAARWNFAPATRGGHPVASAIVVPIRFSLR
jgi:protein TonB